jgi:rod shape-determining protein MreD
MRLDMDWLRTLILLLAALAAVFLEAVVDFPRNWFGAQVNLLPALVIYPALIGDRRSVIAVAFAGGLLADSLSANPPGISVLPLFLTGWAFLYRRELLESARYDARFALGAVAATVVTLLTLAMLLTVGEAPLIGWGSMWQLIVVALSCGLATPALFWLLDRLYGLFAYPPVHAEAFRIDRQIKRGRS